MVIMGVRKWGLLVKLAQWSLLSLLGFLVLCSLDGVIGGARILTGS